MQKDISAALVKRIAGYHERYLDLVSYFNSQGWPSPNPKTYRSELEACEAVTDPKVRQAVEAEEAKFDKVPSRESTIKHQGANPGTQ